MSKAMDIQDRRAEGEVAWPMGMERNRFAQPTAFVPSGFLAAILKDEATATRVKASLEDLGFASQDLRVYTTRQILDDRERYLEGRPLTRQTLGVLTNDQSDIDLYFGYARQGRAALWVHVPDKNDATRAARYMANHQVLHFRSFID